MSSRRDRKAKGKYGKWKNDDMEAALAAVREKKMGLNEAAKTYSVPATTLKRKYAGKNKFSKGTEYLPGRRPDLPREIEDDLVQHILQLENMFYGISRIDFMKLAYEVAERNNLTTRFNHNKKSAGKEWYSLFMGRHPELRLRTPEATSLARAGGFNKVVVGKFFDTYEKIIAENKLSPDRIFNADETGHNVVQKPQKILAQKGKHQIGAITSAERGQNVTGMYAMSASGFYIPPLLIFARKRMKESLVTGAPPGTIFRCQDKGWMDSEGFFSWLKHFIYHVKPSKNLKVLLLLDGHVSHTQSIQAIDLARDNGVIMLSFPAHCTHKMQPLDLAFFKPLKVYFSAAITTKMHENPGVPLNISHVSSLVGTAFSRAATIQVAINGFRKAGLWPPDRYVYTDADFVPATVTDRPLNRPEIEETSEAKATTPPSTSSHPKKSTFSKNESSDNPLNTYTDAEFVPVTVTDRPLNRPEIEENSEAKATTPPSTSSHPKKSTFSKHESSDNPLNTKISELCENPDRTPSPQPCSSNSATYIPVVKIKPLPCRKDSASSVGLRKKRQKLNSSGVILTGTPYRIDLEISKTPKSDKKQNVTKNVFGTTTQVKGKGKQKLKSSQEAKDTSSNSFEKAECGFCGYDYEEDMIKCQKCERWVHEECADLSDEDYYYCDDCKA